MSCKGLVCRLAGCWPELRATAFCVGSLARLADCRRMGCSACSLVARQAMWPSPAGGGFGQFQRCEVVVFPTAQGDAVPFARNLLQAVDIGEERQAVGRCRRQELSGLLTTRLLSLRVHRSCAAARRSPCGRRSSLPSYGSVLSFLVDQGHVEIPRPPSFPGLRFGVPSRASWRATLRHATTVRRRPVSARCPVLLREFDGGSHAAPP